MVLPNHSLDFLLTFYMSAVSEVWMHRRSSPEMGAAAKHLWLPVAYCTVLRWSTFLKRQVLCLRLPRLVRLHKFQPKLGLPCLPKAVASCNTFRRFASGKGDTTAYTHGMTGHSVLVLHAQSYGENGGEKLG